jgi:hypothetical protein
MGDPSPVGRPSVKTHVTKGECSARNETNHLKCNRFLRSYARMGSIQALSTSKQKPRNDHDEQPGSDEEREHDLHSDS